jgi:hypothetical protein
VIVGVVEDWQVSGVVVGEVGEVVVVVVGEIGIVEMEVVGVDVRVVVVDIAGGRPEGSKGDEGDEDGEDGEDGEDVLAGPWPAAPGTESDPGAPFTSA